MIALLNERLWFPDPGSAASKGRWAGLVAVGGDLSADRLLLAYRSGLFPWSEAPITWWSPDPRAVLDWEMFHVSRSLRRTLRRRSFRVTLNHAFERVISECARPRPGRKETWIGTGFVEAYTRLHRQGHAHSVECWSGGQLVGGVYGVALGAFFAGESMFHTVSEASKVALYHLLRRFHEAGGRLVDVQMVTPATQRLGVHLIPRAQFLRRLQEAVHLPLTLPWKPAELEAGRASLPETAAPPLSGTG